MKRFKYSLRLLFTAMTVLAVSLPFWGFVDLENRTLHGNTLVFGLAMLSFVWLTFIAVMKRALLYSARSTVLWLYGSVAVVAMLVDIKSGPGHGRAERLQAGRALFG